MLDDIVGEKDRDEVKDPFMLPPLPLNCLVNNGGGVPEISIVRDTGNFSVSARTLAIAA